MIDGVRPKESEPLPRDYCTCAVALVQGCVVGHSQGTQTSLLPCRKKCRNFLNPIGNVSGMATISSYISDEGNKRTIVGVSCGRSAIL